MSGWKTATINAKADEHNQNLNKAINEKVEDAENVKKLSDDSIGMGGYEADIKSEVGDLLKEIETEKGDKVLIIEANDTTDSGDGVLYEVEHTENEEIKLEQVDVESGYEGAMARDVTGYFRENYNISGFSRIH